MRPRSQHHALNMGFVPITRGWSMTHFALTRSLCSETFQKLVPQCSSGSGIIHPTGSHGVIDSPCCPCAIPNYICGPIRRSIRTPECMDVGFRHGQSLSSTKEHGTGERDEVLEALSQRDHRDQPAVSFDYMADHASLSSQLLPTAF